MIRDFSRNWRQPSPELRKITFSLSKIYKELRATQIWAALIFIAYLHWFWWNKSSKKKKSSVFSPIEGNLDQKNSEYGDFIRYDVFMLRLGWNEMESVIHNNGSVRKIFWKLSPVIKQDCMAGLHLVSYEFGNMAVALMKQVLICDLVFKWMDEPKIVQTEGIWKKYQLIFTNFTDF